MTRYIIPLIIVAADLDPWKNGYHCLVRAQNWMVIMDVLYVQINKVDALQTTVSSKLIL